MPPRHTICIMTPSDAGSAEQQITRELQPENSHGSEEKINSSKKLSAISSLTENRRKKISLARNLISDSPWLSKKHLAEQFGIARSTLYRPGKLAEKDKKYLEQILLIMKDNPDYGQPRIALEMGRNIKVIKRVMKKYGLKTKKRKRRFKKPKDERKPDSEIPNRTKNLCPICPNAIWVGDFTYLRFYGRFVYLATVMDRYTREIVGWSIGLHHSAQLVIDALEHARSRRGNPCIFHSDQGSEYESIACKAWLLAHKILPSHSKKSSPWENGHQESFFGRFKQELGNLHRFKTLDELIEAVSKQMYYYNNKRIHRALKMAPYQKYMEALSQNFAQEIKMKIRKEFVA